MKIKYFLRGLGAGILSATVVLFAVYSYRLSDTKVAERAKEMGMVYQQEQETTQITSEERKTDAGKQTEESTALRETTTGERESEQEESEEKKSEEQTSEAEKESKTQKITEKQTESTENETFSDGTVKISIPSGMKAASLAIMLEELEVVSSAESFKNYLIENNYTHRLRTGEYYLSQGMSYEEIIGMLVQ